MIREELRALLSVSVSALVAEGVLPAETQPEIELERPARAEHGDLSTNLALVLSGAAGMPPRDLAERLLEHIPPAEWVAMKWVAGPGFLNFFLTRTWLQDGLIEIAEKEDSYGRASQAEPVRVQVEFVSANPTGPLHVGAGRNAAYGDVLCRVMEAAGYSVEREYYINDTGAQIENFARSVEARYLEAIGRPTPVPEDGYHGSYLIGVGEALSASHGLSLAGHLEQLRDLGLEQMMAGIKATLARFRVRFDRWFSETSLHSEGKIGAAIAALAEKGHTFEHEDAVWFRSSAFGDSRDRVLVRSNKTTTYLAADIAYLIDKAERGFGLAIYVWGADHHGAVASLQAAAQALEMDIKVEILLYQLVNLLSGGDPVRMSKRTGDIVTLDELLDEVGVDAARFTFLLRSIDSQLDFDLEVAASKSQDNPVYYVQYAHARIASILRYAAGQGIALPPIRQVVLSQLSHDSENDLMRMLADYPDTIELVAKLRAPHRLTSYAQELAATFHAFYRDCRVIGEDRDLTHARLWLCRSTRQVLSNILALMGVEAPESM